MDAWIDYPYASTTRTNSHPSDGACNNTLMHLSHTHQPFAAVRLNTPRVHTSTQCPPPELELTLLRFTGLALTAGGTFLVGELKFEFELELELSTTLTPAVADAECDCDLTTSGLTGLTRSSGGDPFMSSVPPRLGGARGGKGGGGLLSFEPAPAPLALMVVTPFWSAACV
jgi:hypothetical protein